MAYADQRRSGRRLAAIIIVVLLHVVLAYALISGLAVRTVRSMQTDLNVFDVEEEEPPPPEEEPPPPPPDTPIPPPPVQVTQVPVPLSRPAPPRFIPPPRQVVVPRPPAPPPPPPAPPPPSQAARATPRTNLGSLFGPAAYPAASLRNGEQGSASFTLSIGADGRVATCSLTGSTGHPRLDTETCRILQRRARFTPAKNAAGADIASTYTGSIRWEIPE